jgi:hypothetical protein
MSPMLLRPCPGCKLALIASPRARCATCEPIYQQRLAARRGTSAARGYGSQHRTWARQVLRRHPICPCGAPAVVADHVVPWRSGGAKHDASNGQGLCLSCSGRKDGGIRR